VNYEKVMPKTLVLKVTSAADSIIYVMGGPNEDVFCASFVDRAEAEAWVQASCQFGQEIIGVKQDGPAREQSGDVPEKTGGSEGGSLREVQGLGEG